MKTQSIASQSRRFAINLGKDQRDFWTSPLRLHVADSDWLFPATAASAAMVLADDSIERKLPTSPTLIQRSSTFSNLGLAALAGTGIAAYGVGRFRGDAHLEETGLLTGEAVTSSLVAAYPIKFIVGRTRPAQSPSTGFSRLSSSFPSQHSTMAWAAATVISNEYPGPLTKFLAFGTAAAVSSARVIGRDHFTSDAVIGSVMGYYIGRTVYRNHHDPSLAGSSFGSFERQRKSSSFRRTVDNIGSPVVPLDSWVYPAFDRLAALGYVPSAFLGMRPWTRRECVRILREAERLSAGFTDSQGQYLYAALSKEFLQDRETEASTGDIAQFAVDSVYVRYTGIAGVPVDDGFHFSQMFTNDFGRPYGAGSNTDVGLISWGSFGPIAIGVRTEFQSAGAQSAYPTAVAEAIMGSDALTAAPTRRVSQLDRVRLLDTYLSWTWKNLEVSFGKQSLWWGPARNGALVMSTNAEPIPMLRLSRTAPFKLPGPFALLGPIRVEAFWGQLGGQNTVQLLVPNVGTKPINAPLHPHVYIHGERFSFKPTPNLEFGFAETTLFSGPGFPLTFHTFLRSYSLSNTVPGLPGDPGDRRSGFDFSYRLPGLRNRLLLYADSFTEDEFSPIAYPRRSAMAPGIYLPRVPGLPHMDLRVESAYTDLPNLRGAPGSYYFNFHYNSGYTNSGQIIGHWVGREGREIKVSSTYWLSPLNHIDASYRHHWVNPDFLGGGNVNEGRVATQFQVTSALSLALSMQYDRSSFSLLGQHSAFGMSIETRYRLRRFVF